MAGVDPEAAALRAKLSELNPMADAVALVKSSHEGDWDLHGLQIQPYMEHMALMLALYNALEGFARHMVIQYAQATGQSFEGVLDLYVQAIAENPDLGKPDPST
jgi:hypothetical protein